jgi:DNA (cytosine-5)-methyltransferase 1
MRYASVCDGIGAAHVAWQPLGWECAWTSEIEAFPSEVVRQRWGFQNYGDALMHDGAADALPFMRWEDESGRGPELIVSGTPCQSFSVAGLRQGLKDPRGGLMLTFVEIAQRYRPRWLVWENVPGVLSSNGGRDFGALLGALGHLGYGWAYRVLDAQWFGVAQRRRRVFLVGCLADKRRAAAVLFEREGVRGNPPARGAKGASVARALGASTGGASAKEQQYTFVGGNNEPPNALECEPFTKAKRAQSTEDDETWVPGDVSPTINCFDQGDTRATTVVAQGFTYSGYSNKPAWITGDRTDCLPSSGHGDTSHQGIGVMTQTAVRRLTPMECERLQGFPDGYTAITFKGRPASDGPRYKAIGNSMAVPVMRWIGQRIAMVDAMP